jgi:hypothetical protein
MSPKQKKLAAKAPPPNKLDEKDFKVLREEKAKGRGMGLQDEKVQPGKVMKARVGKSIKTGKISDMSFDEKMKRVESGQINKKTGRFTSMNAMRDAKGFQKGETASDFNKRRMKLERAAKVAKSTRLGKILLPVVGAAVAAKTYLNSKMNKKKDVKKKMGGGMMQKPIGYKSGMGPAGAAGPSAGRPSGRRPMQQGPKGGIGSLSKNRSNDDLVIFVNSGDGKIIKMKRSEFEDNMSAPKQKMSGGMIKAKKGHFSKSNVSGHKRVMGVFPTKEKFMERRLKLAGAGGKGTDKVSTKKAEDFMERRKKLAGSKLPGRIGTALGVASMMVPAAYAAMKQYKDYKSAKNRDKAKVKKMGGGMMKKPMGYKEGRSISTRGGGVDSSIIGKIRDAGPFKRIPLGKSRLTDEDRNKIRELMQKRSSRGKALGAAKTVGKAIASAASPVGAAASAVYKLANKMKDKDRMTDRDLDKAKSMVGTSGSKNRPIKKDQSSRNPNPKTPKMMGGGMIAPSQRPGYSKGTMVKARGCKLGRTRPTKIT